MGSSLVVQRLGLTTCKEKCTTWKLRVKFYLGQNEEPMGASQVAPVVKNLPVNAGDIGDAGSIPGLGRSPGGGPSNPLQYSCLENPTDRGACGVQSTGLQRVRHDWSNLAHTPEVYYSLGHSSENPLQRGRVQGQYIRDFGEEGYMQSSMYFFAGFY